jgi:glucose-1-phosphate thymidylyltransferase
MMKGIILCAGRGTRMQPFTYTLPKTLLPVMNRSLLDHGIDMLRAVGIQEIGVVIHPSQTAIVDHLAAVHHDANIQLLKQTDPLGIAHALRSTQKFVGQESFILLLGDNLFTEKLDTLVQSSEGGRKSSLLLKRVPNPQEFGIALIEKDRIIKLEEKPAVPKSDLAVMGAYLFEPSIFEAIYAIKPSKRGEYEITDAIQWLIDHGHSVAYTETMLPSFDVGTHDRWLMANAWMLGEKVDGKVNIGRNTRIEGCKFLGNVCIGDDCVLENAVIGPNVTINNGCVVQNCHIENSILMTGAIVNTHRSVRDSILGRHAVLEGGSNPVDVISCMLGDKSTLQLCELEAEEST